MDSGYTSLSDDDIKIYLEDYEGNALISPTNISDLNNYIFYQDTNSHASDVVEIKDKYKLRVWIDFDVDVTDWNENAKLGYKFKIGVSSEEYDRTAPNLNPKGVIPEGAVYGNLNTGTFYDEMSDEVSAGDVYLYGDYVYMYDAVNGGWYVILATEELFEFFGMSEAFANYPKPTKTQTFYDPILESINGVSIVSVYDLFNGCTYLEIAPRIPSDVTNMERTFLVCASLKTAPVIPNSVIDMTQTFDGCTSLISAPRIPNSVTNMHFTFADCTSLKTAPVISNSVTNMTSTFDGCTSLETAPVIPNSVTNMSHTFHSCSSLKTAPVIPNSVTNMDGTFRSCTSLKIAPVISNSVTDMSSTFDGCTSLETAPVIPNSVTDMSFTFKGCTSLISAPVIPNSVTDMRSTFDGCTSLTGNVEVNAEINGDSENYIMCFSGTKKPIKITGTSSAATKSRLASTANNGNVSY